MTGVGITEATPTDVGILVTLMTEFYAEAGFPLDPRRARSVFEDLQRRPALGRTFLAMAGDQVAGHLVLTMTFSMEYGGLAAFIDDFYIRAAYRNQGVGSFVLAAVRDWARDVGVRAIHLEVGRNNAPAHAVYRKAGFVDSDRQLLTLQLAAAAHEETLSTGA